MQLEKYKKTINNNNGKNARMYLCMPYIRDLKDVEIQKLKWMQQNYNTTKMCIDFLIRTYDEIHKGK